MAMQSCSEVMLIPPCLAVLLASPMAVVGGEVMLIPPCLAVLLASPMAVVGAVLVVIGWVKRRRALWVGGLVFIGLSVAGAVIMAAVMMWRK